MTPDEFRAHDAIALAALVAGGEVSVREVTDASIRLVERRNPQVNAVVAERFEGALDQAARMDAARPEGAGPLWGVPFLLKDVNLVSADLPTRFASRFFAGTKPGRDSTLVRRWREAGLVTLGTSNTPEFAGDFTTEPVAYGPTCNPWNEGVTVGGSSGGAGAAVAAGMVPLAHGTDLGGSIRIPAACCGVFGFKPSVGLNPLGPHREEIAGGLDADHALSRSVRDSAASLDVTAGPDAGTRIGRALPPGGFLRGLDEPVPPLRIGICLDDPSGRRAGAAQVAATERAAMLLEDLGHRVEPYCYPARIVPGPWFDALWTPDVLHLVWMRVEGMRCEPREEELEPMTWAILDLAKGTSALDHLFAQLEMVRVAQALGQSMAEVDAVMTPARAEDPLPLGTLTFVANESDLERWNAWGYAFAPFATPANLGGQPAAVCPVEIGSSGLPVAVQLAGRPGDDLKMLRLARDLEEVTGWGRVLREAIGRG